MKHIKTNIIISFLAIGLVYGQDNALEDNTPVKKTDEQTSEASLSPYIPPLEVLIDSALNNSPLIKILVGKIEIINQEKKITKKKWMDYIYVDGAGNYGLYDQLVINGQRTDELPYSGSYTQSEQMKYHGGISIKMPITSILSRRNEIKIKKLTLENTKYELHETRQSIEQIITEEYYQLKYLEESMKTYQEMYQTLEISYLKSKKDLENGRVKLESFSLLVSTKGKAKDSFLKAKNNFYAQYKKLQILSGISFNTMAS